MRNLQTKERSRLIFRYLSTPFAIMIIAAVVVFLSEHYSLRPPSGEDKTIADLRERIKQDSIILLKENTGCLVEKTKILKDATVSAAGALATMKTQEALIKDYDFQLRRCISIIEDQNKLIHGQ